MTVRPVSAAIEASSSTSAHRPDERLLAEHVLAGPEHRLDLRAVEVGRGAQVDDVDLVVGQHLVEVGGRPHVAQPPGDLRGQVAVEVADRAHAVEVAHVLQGEHVGPADAEADDGDSDGLAAPRPRTPCVPRPRA